MSGFYGIDRGFRAAKFSTFQGRDLLANAVLGLRLAQCHATPGGNVQMANMLANIFGSSPVQPLEKHMEIAYRCAKQAPAPFSTRSIANDWDEGLRGSRRNRGAGARGRRPQERDSAEHAEEPVHAGAARRSARVAACAGQDRQPYQGRVGRDYWPQDANSGRPSPSKFVEFVDRNVDAAKQARKSVRELDELFTAGFKGAEVTLVADMIEKLDQIETHTDEQQTILRAALFEIEKTLDPIDAMFLYDVISLTGEIADMAERVGRRLELLLAH